MKLRNKKTGRELDVAFHSSYKEGKITIGVEEEADPVYPKCNFGNYDSLEKFCEDWEDVQVPTEPLIKDEKIRKAVRAWAKAEGETQVHVTHCRKRILSIWTATKDNGNINFDCDIEPFDEGSYTITELCGEDEE